MKFNVSETLKKSTTRAKSDVANKLVSMFLHEVSRKKCLEKGLFVSDPTYGAAVFNAFGDSCLYCGCKLEKDRVSVEHLNGMNRICLGLHVPGNVAISCKSCNNRKRQDDQHLTLSENGWESFLSHDGTKCEIKCNTCAYWRSAWPLEKERTLRLAAARERIHKFQLPYNDFIQWSDDTREQLRKQVEILYRDCQNFATAEILKLTTALNL